MPNAQVLLCCDHRGEGLAALLPSLEAAGYRIQTSRNLRQSLELFARVEPSVLVVDPLSSGSIELEALDRARSAEPPVPVLLVTDPKDALAAVIAARSLERGSWDLVRRDAPAEEFVMRIESLKSHYERLQEMSELRHRALYDDRTELLRPHGFQERLREHFSAAQRHHLSLALLIIDLDRFGQINKQNDHTVGDYVISQVGGSIRAALRTEDVAGRLGGDEFAVLLPYTRTNDAAHVVQRLLDAIRALSGPMPGARGAIEVSASIGYETFDGTDLDSSDTLRLHAEEALRLAKQSGGNRGIYFRTPTEDKPTPPAK
ncbi:MAG: diguanylate cyclase [Planctomycetes bacterium]|nr:diguanylate cyclase [Planctomycetota bacterium]